ncbi:efflux RND transporter permease subunit [Candidatus Magnetominusculus xianensis]|uniref:Cation transporter n=1 Tax=Candidatus Magnetominusculus xianensis TaxID=1748249 RepID=A0ABR5SH62_9BACT|nr:CusA/CzcA family heavy metal efflux RND transporter [Candidatus Magnetominusculus xianensis]KWT91027.1 cation transporter [Candidatus Magnetominusculus xianensis]MBF0402580.1 efflux RND transporter permease subunit [Nitrospirota bacterium]
MIAKLIAYSARNRFIVVLLVAFLFLWGLWALKKTPLDAIPDLSDTQVIIYTQWNGRAPDLIEDQITYPITATLLAAPKVKAVRGFSFFGTSFIYVIFEEGTDIYWARSRVLEYLQGVKAKIPADVNPVLGPDATGLGWGFEYAVVDETGGHDLSETRTLQDYNLKLALESVPGVSEVASIGGFVKQYQINIDPNRLAAYNIPITKVLEAVKKSNRDVEGRVLEFSGTEYMVRGRGYIKNVGDIEAIPVGTNGAGTPIFIKDIAQVRLGPEIRRGIADLDGRGEVAGGIVVVRFGENVLDVIERVKAKIKNDIEPSLPKGVKIVTTYDRSDLIGKAIDTLKDEIIKLSIAVSVVCVVFLFHLPSALVVILTLPIAIVMSFICMYYLGVTSNIMSLSGIAIAIGAMVDASIIMVEQAHTKLEQWEHDGRPGSRVDVVIEAAQEVGPSLFFSLLVITVGFLPVFTLQEQAGRLFKPLAYTKTFAMLFSSFLAVTITPVLMTMFIRGKIIPEERNPVSKVLHFLYEPVARLSLRLRWIVIILALIIMGATVYPYKKLGTEFMPPLYEGTLFYMPVTVPGASVSEAGKLLQMQDEILKTIPEVAQVFGKAGRAETATDPAPIEMFETIVNLKPESQWRKGLTVEDLKNEMNDALSIPGVANSFTMPIKARIDMLSTGIRTPVGIKILGPKLEEIERIGIEIENAVKTIPGTRSAYAERVMTGYFLDFEVKRKEAARYGLTVDDVQEVIQSAVGGMNLTTTVEGRQRFPVNVRYLRDLRGNIDDLKRVLVPIMSSNPKAVNSTSSSMSVPAQLPQIPISEIADIKITHGPTAIKSEEGLLTAYVYIDFSGRDVGSYVEEAKRRVSELIKIPSGYRLKWSGEYEYIVETHKRLKLVIPLTVFVIFVLVYINTQSAVKTAIVLLAVPFSLVGSFWILYLLNYNMSIAVWVGMIALAGLDAETGVVMLLYLELSYDKWRKEGRLNSYADLKEAVMHGAVKRIRPKIMTVSVILAGLIPVMFSSGAGSDVMKRIAAPMVGGVVTSTILELIIYPAIYIIWKGRGLKR